MKLKRIAIVIVVCIIVSSIFGSIVVFAPPQGPLLPAPIEVVNPPDTSLEVTTPEGQSLDVTLDEPIEVVNQAGTSLDVTLDEPIDVVVTNPNSAADISGWLHTKKSDTKLWNEFLGPLVGNSGSWVIDTEGFREITVVFESSQNAVDFGIGWTINGDFSWAEGWQYGNEKPPSYTVPDGSTPRNFFKTYAVQGESLYIDWHAAAGILSSGELVSIAYYLTT